MTLENPPFCLILALTISHKKSKISSITNINHDVEVLVVRLGHINSNKTTLEYPESAIINVVLVEFSKALNLRLLTLATTYSVNLPNMLF